MFFEISEAVLITVYDLPDQDRHGDWRPRSLNDLAPMWRRIQPPNTMLQLTCTRRRALCDGQYSAVLLPVLAIEGQRTMETTVVHVESYR